MKQLWLSELLLSQWGNDPDTVFERVFQLDGEDFRRVKSRRTFRFVLQGRAYFAKVHRGIGWKEIFKDLLQGKKPVLGAANEFAALQLLNAHGLPTMTPAGFGSRYMNPARRESFLITEELPGMTSLEDLALTEDFPRLRRWALRKLAEHVGTMHRLGVNHRDCYICHYLLDPAAPEDRRQLYVIDLHRSQIRKKVPRRYLQKDLAGLLFSALDLNLSKYELLTFICLYCRAFPAAKLERRADFWRQVEKKASRLYRKEFSRPAPPLAR